MKKSLHPGAIAAIVAVFVVAIGAMFVRFGNGEVRGVSMADAMRTTHGNTVNTFTGEPLTEPQKLAAQQQEAQYAAMQARSNPQKSGTAPNFGGRQD